MLWARCYSGIYNYKTDGYEIFENPITDKIHLILPSKEIIGESEISTRVVNQYKKEILTIVNHYEKE
mgnify:CR=1 FL=1